MNQQLISIVTPTYGRTFKLKNAILSVLSQSYVNFEHIIIDDNGLDSEYQKNNKKLIKEFDDNRLRYYPLEKNSGACSARNNGISLANGEFLLFLDDDDEFPGLYWQNFVENSHYLDEKDNLFSFLFVPYQSNILTKYKITLQHILYRNYVGNSIFIKRQLLNDQKFDSNLSAAQDYDLWIRIIKNYGPALGINGKSIKHNKEGKRITNSNNAAEGYLSVLNKNKSIMSKKQISSMHLSIDILIDKVNFLRYKGIKNKLRAVKYLIIKLFFPDLYLKYYV